jgi:hypothetical protein
MNIIAFIMVMVPVGIVVLTKEEHRPAVRRICDPLAGIGVVLWGLANFMSGTMIGSERSDALISVGRHETIWTLEDDPAKFIFVNSVLIVLGAGLVLWSLFFRKD